MAADKLGETTVYVNVFNGSEHSKVEMALGDGGWTAMQHAREIDPSYAETYAKEEAVLAKAPNWRQMSKPKESTHLWKGRLPATSAKGTLLLKIRATDVNGDSLAAQRVIRVQSPASGSAAN